MMDFINDVLIFIVFMLVMFFGMIVVVFYLVPMFLNYIGFVEWFMRGVPGS